jgi:membrane protease YdiL (CAAX protease family)
MLGYNAVTMDEIILPREEERFRKDSTIANRAIFFVLALIIVWTLLLWLNTVLTARFNVIAAGPWHIVYYVSRKILLWVLPALFLIHHSGLGVRTVIGLNRFRQIVVWGAGVGLILGATATTVKILTHQPLFQFAVAWPFVNAVLLSPIVEEIVFRGALLESLKTRYSFIRSNLITGILFVSIHVPGWFFQGRLRENLTSPTGAISIFLLGLVFGYVAHKSKSVAASTVTHSLSNLFNFS